MFRQWKHAFYLVYLSWFTLGGGGMAPVTPPLTIRPWISLSIDSSLSFCPDS